MIIISYHQLSSAIISYTRTTTYLQLHLDLDQAHPYFVAVFEDELYWSDWYLSGIIAAHKMTGKDMRTIVDGKATGFTVHVVHPVLQPKGMMECSI